MNVFEYFFEETALLERNFVIGSAEQISFQELYSRVKETEEKLTRQIGENNNIFLISENSVFFIIAYLAILKSGNICIPINPSLEKENLDKIIKLAETDFAFIGKRQLRRFESFQFTLLNDFYSTGEVSEENHASNSGSTDFDENRIAEIIFTSGSTGEQKGVMISHKNIIANTRSIIQYLGLAQNDIMQVVLPFHYCYGLSLLHTHLRAGASIIMNNSFIFLGAIINDLKKYKCTGFAGVPSHFQILLRKSKNFTKTSFPDLRYITQAGGKLHTSFIKEFISAFPDIDFFVMYGQTEATARLTYLPPNDLNSKTGSIGKSIPNVNIRVIDKNGTQIEPGQTGEIIAQGDNIMHGYFKDKAATDKALKDGWLYTGDLATVDEEGYIYIQSRKKEIIKVRGIRISPKEIEEVIVRFPGVIDCSIQAYNDEITGEAIKAILYINESDMDQFKPDDIKQHCANFLSSHKIPQEIEFETKLTFNTSGKKVK